MPLISIFYTQSHGGQVCTPGYVYLSPTATLTPPRVRVPPSPGGERDTVR